MDDFSLIPNPPALVRVPSGAPFYGWFFEYWGAYRFFPFGRSLDPAYVTRLYLALPAFLFALPTVLMGFSFPALQRAVHDEARTSGRKVGALQAANIVGCVAGSLLVGLVSLDRLGTAGTLRLLPVLGLAFAAVGWRHYGRAYAGAAAHLLAVAVGLPDNEALWRRLNGVLPGEARALFEEDATGVVAVAHHTISHILDEMNLQAVGQALVYEDNNTPVGIITRSGLTFSEMMGPKDEMELKNIKMTRKESAGGRKQYRYSRQLPLVAEDIMTAPIKTINADMRAVEASKMLAESQNMGMPVLENGDLVGYSSANEIINEIARW